MNIKPLRVAFPMEVFSGVLQLSERIGSSLPSTSPHLRHLHQAGIVQRKRCGQAMIDRIRASLVAELCYAACRMD